MSETSIKRASLINFFAKYSTLIIQILYNAILARILSPNDFGIVAIISVFVTFFMLFADMGFGSAIIQNKTLSKTEINDIFSFTLYLGLLLMFLFSAFSWPLSIFYENDVYIPIGLLLSIALFFSTLNIVPNAILLKNKKFKTVGLRIVVVALTSSTFTIILAFFGFGYYAIVINSILTAFFTFLWNFKSTDINIKLKFKFISILKISEYSTFQFAFNFVNYFSRNLDSLLIGKFLGNTQLAYYDRSYKLMLYPLNNLTHVITPVLHPILSDFQKDKAYIFTQYIKVVKILSLIGIFVSGFCIFAAEEIILIFYGDQWIEAVPSFRLLSLSIWVQMISSSSGAIYQSLGNTKLLFLNGVLTAIISVVAIFIGLSFNSINAVAGFVSLAFYLHFLINYFILIKIAFRYKLWAFLKNFVPDCIVLIITFSGFYLASYIVGINNIFLSLLLKGLVGGVSFLFGLVITKQHKYLLNLIRRSKR